MQTGALQRPTHAAQSAATGIPSQSVGTRKAHCWRHALRGMRVSTLRVV